MTRPIAQGIVNFGIKRRRPIVQIVALLEVIERLGEVFRVVIYLPKGKVDIGLFFLRAPVLEEQCLHLFDVRVFGIGLSGPR